MLFVHESADRLPGRAVGLDAIGPEILAEDAPGFFHMVDEERQRQMQSVGVIEAVDRK